MSDASSERGGEGPEESVVARAEFIRSQELAGAIRGPTANKLMAAEICKRKIFRGIKFRISNGKEEHQNKFRNTVLTYMGIKEWELETVRADTVWGQVKKCVECTLRTRRNSVRDAVKIKMRGRLE